MDGWIHACNSECMEISKPRFLKRTIFLRKYVDTSMSVVYITLCD